MAPTQISTALRRLVTVVLVVPLLVGGLYGLLLALQSLDAAREASPYDSRLAAEYGYEFYMALEGFTGTPSTDPNDYERLLDLNLRLAATVESDDPRGQPVLDLLRFQNVYLGWRLDVGLRGDSLFLEVLASRDGVAETATWEALSAALERLGNLHRDVHGWMELHPEASRMRIGASHSAALLESDVVELRVDWGHRAAATQESRRPFSTFFEGLAMLRGSNMEEVEARLGSLEFAEGASVHALDSRSLMEGIPATGFDAVAFWLREASARRATDAAVSFYDESGEIRACGEARFDGLSRRYCPMTPSAEPFHVVQQESLGDFRVGLAATGEGRALGEIVVRNGSNHTYSEATLRVAEANGSAALELPLPHLPPHSLTSIPTEGAAWPDGPVLLRLSSREGSFAEWIGYSATGFGPLL